MSLDRVCVVVTAAVEVVALVDVAVVDGLGYPLGVIVWVGLLLYNQPEIFSKFLKCFYTYCQ